MKNRKVNFKKRYLSGIALVMGLIFISSCNDGDKGYKEYDPSLPVVIDEIYPDSGGYFDEVILRGENLGSDPKRLRVFFNQKEAIVVGASGDRALIHVPKLPGEECKIGMLFDGNTTDTVFCNQSFKYQKNYQLQYVCGQVGSTNVAFVEGSFQTTEFGKSMYNLTVDPEGVIYLNHRAQNAEGSLVYIDENEYITKFIAYGDANAGEPAAPWYDEVTQKVYFTGMRRGYFWEVDPYDSYAVVLRQLVAPNTEYQAKGYRPYKNGDLMWCYSFVRAKDAKGEEWIYCRAYDGTLFRCKFEDRVYDVVGVCPSGAVDNFICGDPEDNTKIYCSLKQKNIVTCLDLSKDISDPGFETVVCGVGGMGGSVGDFQDGHSSIAKMSYPEQILLTRDPETSEKIMYICDSKNCCVRQFNLETNMMTTVAGIGKQKGFSTGSPKESKLNWPAGICLSPNGDIYIADAGNRVIMKLMFL